MHDWGIVIFFNPRTSKSNNFTTYYSENTLLGAIFVKTTAMVSSGTFCSHQFDTVPIRRATFFDMGESAMTHVLANNERYAVFDVMWSADTWPAFLTTTRQTSN